MGNSASRVLRSHGELGLMRNSVSWVTRFKHVLAPTDKLFECASQPPTSEAVIAMNVDGSWRNAEHWRDVRRTAGLNGVDSILRKKGRGALTPQQRSLYKATACDAIWTLSRLFNAG